MDHPRIASIVEENFSAKATRVKRLEETKNLLEMDKFKEVKDFIMVIAPK